MEIDAAGNAEDNGAGIAAGEAVTGAVRARVVEICDLADFASTAAARGGTTTLGAGEGGWRAGVGKSEGQREAKSGPEHDGNNQDARSLGDIGGYTLRGGPVKVSCRVLIRAHS